MCYWGVNDVLTRATVFPTLDILEEYFDLRVLATIERDSEIEFSDSGIVHVHIKSLTYLPFFFRKISDYILFFWKLYWTCKNHRIDIVLCRGAMAGFFGFLLKKTLKIDFVTESFEPHAAYMVEGGTWKSMGREYRLQSYFEKKQLEHARFLITVSHLYKRKLEEIDQVPINRLFVIPCCVNEKQFSYSTESGQRIRRELNIDITATVGIYVGKFGDIYYDEESFEIFKHTFTILEDSFYLIILSTDPRDEIFRKLKRHKIPEDRTFVATVPHSAVPDYLSAADFAYSLIRTSPSRKFCSPIKNGEYWANGLPTFITLGIGDDEIIINKNHSGVVLDVAADDLPDQIRTGLDFINQKSREEWNLVIKELAIKYRSYDLAKIGYSKIFGEVS